MFTIKLQNWILLINKRSFTKTLQNFKNSNIKLKGKGTSSQNWLVRQSKDPYVAKAQTSNYRCRSAFKLLEIDEKYKLLHPGQCVLDCGAAPGSWTQVAVMKTNSLGKNETAEKGSVIAVDLQPMYPIKGAEIVGNTDLSDVQGLNRIKQILNDRSIDLFMSDAAPNASGIKEADHDKIIQLAYILVRFNFEISKINSNFLIKIWDGRSSIKFINDIHPFYDKVKRIKPAASRMDSAEVYILATGFKGVSRK